METSEGWENSMTKVLENFEDLSYEINPSLGFTYIKGKADPQQIISQLSKGGNHAKIEWISNGFSREDQNQVQQEQPSRYYYNYLDPYYHHATYPYQHNIYQLNPPYPNWYNNSQNALPYGNHHVPEHQHNRHNMFEVGSFSGRSFDSHCPVRSNNHHSDSGDSSPPFIRPEINNQTNGQPIQPTKPQPSGFLKKLVDKLCFKC
ncbi:hypothetical protein TSUD_180400 [Trifolium subterraneum]|uniref:Uncharacterized protein n=1 Tax=Trifolium subterraneum TaxID=3900 RepID=A0A2Z6PHV4_TRISU|nr:hypothetical protein TSUD_180400 [Trifolium subterraneum]